MNYGIIDVFFIDGLYEKICEFVWDFQFNIVVMCGVIFIFEQVIFGLLFDIVWEFCFMMGIDWQYKFINDVYKIGGQFIFLLVEICVKGGNFFFNIGLKFDGEIFIEEEMCFCEIVFWMFINSECIYSVCFWVIINEGDVWFIK